MLVSGLNFACLTAFHISDSGKKGQPLKTRRTAEIRPGRDLPYEAARTYLIAAAQPRHDLSHMARQSAHTLTALGPNGGTWNMADRYGIHLKAETRL
jgi:hypothetical protein